MEIASWKSPEAACLHEGSFALLFSLASDRSTPPFLALGDSSVVAHDSVEWALLHRLSGANPIKGFNQNMSAYPTVRMNRTTPLI